MLLPWNKPARLEVGTGQVLAWIAPPGKGIVKAAVPLLLQDENPGAQSLEQHNGLTVAIRSAIMQLAAKCCCPIQSLDVEIGGDYVFYNVIETDTRCVSPIELRRLAALALADTFGLDPAGLVARCAIQAGGRSIVACAAPVALTKAIRDAVNAAGRKVNRLKPGFAAFLYRHRACLKERNAIIARLDGDLLMLALLDDNKWRAFAVERIECGDWSELRDSCDAFCRRLCVNEPDRFPVWYSADVADVANDPDTRWRRLPTAPSDV